MTIKRPLAQAVLSFRLAVVDAEGPAEFHDIFKAVDAAMFSPTPEKVFNTKMGQLRRNRPGVFFRLNRWLTTHQVKAISSKHGVYWAWRIWRLAAVRMHNGLKASVAFGMNKNGRPPLPGFTRADDAAGYAVHMIQTGQAQTVAVAVSHAATLYRARVTEVMKSMKIALSLAPENIVQMVKDSRLKRC